MEVSPTGAANEDAALLPKVANSQPMHPSHIPQPISMPVSNRVAEEPRPNHLQQQQHPAQNRNPQHPQRPQLQQHENEQKGTNYKLSSDYNKLTRDNSRRDKTRKKNEKKY